MKAGIKAVTDARAGQGRLAHQRRQLWRQARQVPLPSEGFAAVKALTFTLRETPPERLDLSPLTPRRAGGVDGEGDRARSGSACRKRALDGRRHLPRVRQRRAEHRLRRRQQPLRRRRHGHDGRQRPRRRRCRRAGRTQHARRAASWSRAMPGPHAGSGMRGGRLEIIGNAGDHLGGPLAGELAGMNGGVLIVRGSAGAYAADRMRRGADRGAEGLRRPCRRRMIAGTLVVAGGAGRDAGLSDAARLDPARPRAGRACRRASSNAARPTACSPPSSTAI